MSLVQKKPMRRCVVCMTSYPQEQLTRLTLHGDIIVVDESGRASGRGMYICRNTECIDGMIKKKAFNRACKSNLDAEMLKALQVELLNRLKEEKNVKES
ncbi:MAG: YlxR family protein [Clostridiales bacterium]|nr:YlxR family protein [Candidatus Crickella merdequi]